MMLEYFRQQFDYDLWANLRAVETVLVSFEEVRKSATEAKEPRRAPRDVELFDHILAAHKIWLARIRGTNNEWPAWGTRHHKLKEEAIIRHRAWMEYFGEIDETALQIIITYKNSRLEVYRNTVEEILTHLLLHSAYHRGQIASFTRGGGRMPAETDYILYARSRR